jgi:exodeoxyribonuclease-3
MKKGLADSLDAMEADVVGLQEVRALRSQVPNELATLAKRGWYVHIAAAKRKGYSGVALLCRTDPSWIDGRLGMPRFDDEGRFVAADVGGLIVANGYFPNGNGSVLENGKRSNDRVPYKLDFYRTVDTHLGRYATSPVLAMGDFNTAHEDIDLARPKQNRKTSGFLPEERAELDRWLTSGWTDSFREQHRDEEGHYTWWAQRSNCRARNVGWRIDYILASAAAKAGITRAWIMKEVTGSDHCPLAVEWSPPTAPDNSEGDPHV